MGESARQLPDAPNKKRALIRNWDKRKHGACQLRFSTRERIPGENYPQFGHSPAEMFASLALGRKNLKNIGIYFSPPMPPHVLMNFCGFPPGCGYSVADF